ncbi:mycothiol system anti-sigma-R factor [Streptomyces xinghaiensis]|uniref:mycothiol system anti-sigma-R factor n=1 Tax=Streptomyces xinghaiensis TaxID=1038928 RepID=UPI003430209D
MSCGNPHEIDCSEILDHLYEFLDQEMPAGDRAKFETHIDECSPCLEKYGLEQAVKKLVKRCCGHDDVPTDLRSKVMGRIELVRSGQAVPEKPVMERGPAERDPGSCGTAEASRETDSSAAAARADSA